MKPLLVICLLLSIISNEISLLSDWVSDAPTEIVEKSMEGKKSSEGEEKSEKNNLDVDYFFNPHPNSVNFHDRDYPMLQYIPITNLSMTLEIPQPPPEHLA